MEGFKVGPKKGVVFEFLSFDKSYRLGDLSNMLYRVLGTFLGSKKIISVFGIVLGGNGARSNPLSGNRR